MLCLNADDVFDNTEVVSSIAAAAAASVCPDAVFGDLVYVAPTDVTRVLRYWRSGAFSQRRLRFGWMPPHPTFYVRKDSLQLIEGFNTGFRIAADYDFMLRYLSRPGIRATYLTDQSLAGWVGIGGVFGGH